MIYNVYFNCYYNQSNQFDQHAMSSTSKFCLEISQASLLDELWKWVLDRISVPMRTEARIHINNSSSRYSIMDIDRRLTGVISDTWYLILELSQLSIIIYQLLRIGDA